jgi:hypothetical protein
MAKNSIKHNDSRSKCYLSRFAFHAQPGKTGEVEEELQKLAAMVAKAGGKNPRILHVHFASIGAPDVIFEQEAAELSELESQISKLTDSGDFQMWTKKMSSLLTESPKREIYLVRNSS